MNRMPYLQQAQKGDAGGLPLQKKNKSSQKGGCRGSPPARKGLGANVTSILNNGSSSQKHPSPQKNTSTLTPTLNQRCHADGSHSKERLYAGE